MLEKGKGFKLLKGIYLCAMISINLYSVLFRLQKCSEMKAAAW